MVKVPLLLASAVAALVIPGIASADLVFNGGFETGDFTGWILSGNPIAGTVDTANPHSGSYAADLIAAGSPTFMAQSLTTTSGTKYDLTYFLDVSSDSTGGPVEFIAQVNGVTVFDQKDIPPQPYTGYSFPFLATGTSTDLKFGFRNDPGSFFLDDVSVAAVPEPSSVWLGFLGTAFAIVAICRRQQADTEPRS
ncbi:MAG TPA: carbohydrate binding domain-containing protein [Bryobacteraceae bacterium]|jgi:hypothetical protein|nr:carbohydrate binding domain-containing protein [Bryobacteraceae bacterium]